eukprot:jgi/Chrzof1/1822/Cz10g22140.t1
MDQNTSNGAMTAGVTDRYRPPAARQRQGSRPAARPRVHLVGGITITDTTTANAVPCNLENRLQGTALAVDELENKTKIIESLTLELAREKANNTALSSRLVKTEKEVAEVKATLVQQSTDLEKLKKFQQREQQLLESSEQKLAE